MPQKDNSRFVPKITEPNISISVDRVRSNTVDALADGFMLDTHLGQWLQSREVRELVGTRNAVEAPNYNAFLDPRLNISEMSPMIFDDLVRAESYEQVLSLQEMSRRNFEREQRLEGHGLARFMSQLADPYNFIPVPMAMGRGFVQGFKRTLGPNAAIVTAAEAGRTYHDPNDTIGQTALNVTMGTLLASGIGGAFGMIPYTPRDIAAKFEAWNAVQERVNANPTPENAPKFPDLEINEARVQKWRDSGVVDASVTPQDIIRGTADDGLGPNVIRLQRLRRPDQAFGDRVVIRKDEQAGDFVMEVNGDLVMRGSRRELIDEADGIGTEKVQNFYLVEALDRGSERLDDVYPEAPDPTKDPEAFKQYQDDNLPYDAPRDENGVREPKPSGYFNNHTVRHYADSERLSMQERLAEQDAEIAALKAEQEVQQRKLRHRNQYSDPRETIQARLDNIDARLNRLDTQRVRTKERLDEAEMSVELANQSDDPLDYMMKSTGIGLEKLYSKSQMFPWFRLTGTKLAKLAPDLAVEWQKIPYRLAASPGLMFKGGEKGVSVGTSAEMQATQYWWYFREAKRASNTEYARLYGYGDKISPMQQEAMEWRDDATGLARKVTRKFKKGEDAFPESGDMTFDEFHDQIGLAMQNNGKVPEARARDMDKNTITAIENSASHWRQFLDKFKNEGEALGVFQTQRTVARRIGRVQQQVEDFEAEIASYEAGDMSVIPPFRGVEAEVIYQKIDASLGREPDPVTGRFTMAMRRYDPETRKSTIYLDREGLLRGFEEKAWKRGKYPGIITIGWDFKTPREWERFVLAHEKAHVKYPAREGEGLVPYENRINKMAIEELNNLKSDKYRKLNEGLIKAKRKELDRLTLQLDQLEQMRDQMKGISGDEDWLDPNYFFRVWNREKIRQDEDAFKDILFAWYTENPYIYDFGKRVKLPTDDASIRARVDDTYNRIVNEADEFNPVVESDIVRERKISGRLEELESQLDEIQSARAADGEVRSAEIKDITRKITLYNDLLKDIKTRGIDKAGLQHILPTPLRSRNLDIPNNLVSDFINNNVEHVAHIYLQKMAPVLEITRNFGDRNVNAYRVPLNNALIDRIETARANGDTQLADALEKEMHEVNQSVDTLVEIVTGVYGKSKDPANLTGKVVRTSMAWMNMVAMGKATLVALNDFGNYVGYVGWKRAFGDTWRYVLARARDDMSEWNIGRKEVLMSGDAFQIETSQRMQALTDIGGMEGYDRFDRVVQKGQRRMFIANLLTTWTDFMEGMTGTMAQSVMIRDAIALADGKLTPARATELRKLGMTDVLARKISDHWHALPEAERQGRHLFLANTNKWNDPATERAFRAMLATEIQNLVPAPRAADKPTFMHKDWGRLMFQYKGFSFAATSRIMMANLQRRDARALNTVLAMIGMSWLVDMAKRPDFIELDLEDSLFRAVEISGVAGILSDVNQSIEGVTGGEYGLRPTLGLESMERDVSTQTRFGAVGGAVPNLVTSFGAAFLSDDADTADQARAIRYMIPYNNLLYWSWLVDRFQRTAVDTLE